MKNLPAEPPDDGPSFRAWARALADAAPEDRREALEELPDPASDPWAEALARLFPGAAGRRPGDRSATALLEALASAGLDPEAGRDLLADVLDHDAFQGMWADWETVADRRETRQRALLLARTDDLSPDQADFLLFALRASDPAVYHPAAVAVGRHALTSPDVRDVLSTYARERGLDLEAPLALDDDRSRRRLLLVQAGARAASLEGHGRPGDVLPDPPPLPADLPEDPSDPLPEAPADVVAVLRAVTTRREAGDADPRLREGVAALVAGIPDLPEATMSRWVVEAWSDLLVATGDPSAHEDAARRLLVRLADVPDPPSGSLARPLPALLRLDSVLAALPRLPDPLAEALLEAGRDAAGRDLRALVLARACTWAARHDRANPDWVDDAVDRLEHGDADLLRAAALASLEAPGAEGVDVLGALGSALRGGPSWPGRSPRERAVLSFLALDAVRAGDPPPDRARPLLADAGLLPDAAGPADSLLGLLLEGLLGREPDGAEAFLDARFLHEAASPRLLLAVLGPAAEAPPDGVADALEHHLRTRIHADPTFDPLAFLARTAVRRPDPRVYEALAEVSTGRTYPRPDGSAFPLETFASHLARDAAEARSPPEVWSDAEARSHDALGPARDRLRDRLAAVRDPGPADEAVRDLVDAVGGGPPGASPPADTVRGLVRAIHPRQGPLLTSGSDPWTLRTRVELEDATGDALRRVEDRIPDLRPRRLQGLAGGADPASDIVDALADVRAAAVPHLPGPEADLLEAAIGAVEEQLGRWSRGLDDLLEVWDPEAGPDGGDELLEAVTARWSPPDRALILAVALRSVADPEAEDEPDAAAALEWALDRPVPEAWTPGERELWEGWVRRLWVRVTRAAMGGETERDALVLLTDDRYEPARQGPEAEAVLDEAEAWCFDRYRLLPAARLRGGSGAASLPGATAAFLGHFSAVWLALVVGAILMLDFGDAWREMAAAGDVQGVVVTSVVGVGGAFAYTLADLRGRPGATPGRLASVARAGAFVGVCLAWALAVTASLWWLLSGTDQVVHGAGAPLHVAVWAGFALFVGIFFGLVAKET